jgi:hypothetical protein
MCDVLLPPGVNLTAVKYIYTSNINFFSLALQPSAGYGFLVSPCFLITYYVASQSVGLLWTIDQLVAETSTWQHTTRTTNIHASGGIRTHNRGKRAAADLSLKVPIHVRVWVASAPRGAWLGSQLGYICIYIIGKSPARDTPHTDEFDSLEPEPSGIR